MENYVIIEKVDHSVLSTTLTFEELKREIDFALEAGCACLAITPNYVKRASDYIKSKKGKIAISSAISFPRGDTTTACKVYEISDSIKNGATEIDCMVNLCEVKNGNFDYIENEFVALRKAAGALPLKIIIETSELNNDEKIRLAKLITQTGIDYVKTSTGFSSGGATFEDVLLLKENIGENVKIKASGGIKTREQAVKFIELGVSRIGTKFTRDFIL